MKDFATKKLPLRGSAIPELLRCSLRHFLLARGVLVDGDSEASQTGSALHRAAEIFHRGKSFAATWKALTKERKKYPLADFDAVEKMFKGYAADPANQVKPVLCEAEIVVKLPAWPTDKTGQEIYIVGHLDQVRKIDGKLYVVDIKTTKKWGADALASYAAQLVIYSMGATEKLGKPVSPGYILRARAYAQKEVGDVMFKYPYDVPPTALVDAIRREVAMVRLGDVLPRPSSGCQFCPAGHVGYCSSLLQDLEVKR